jgi:hypothetical protein
MSPYDDFSDFNSVVAGFLDLVPDGIGGFAEENFVGHDLDGVAPPGLSFFCAKVTGGLRRPALVFAASRLNFGWKRSSHGLDRAESHS